MPLNKILKLGNPKLHEKSKEVSFDELNSLQNHLDLLNDLILKFRKLHGAGRGIAAPQIGLMKRIICLNLNDKRHTLINPVLSNFSDETFELWDDCMCFPNLLVKVNRHKSCTVTFKDQCWEEHTWELNGDLSELIQHEYDHLDGILATQRAIDGKSFKLKK